MSLPLPDFGLTSWVDFTNDSEITADAQLRVSAVGDSLGLINDFTQSTDANKPLWSRIDNKENGFKYSHDISQADWVASNITKSAPFMVAGNNSSTKSLSILSGFSGTQYLTVIGNVYKVQGRLKHDNWQYAYVRFQNATTGITIDLTTGAIASIFDTSGTISGETATLNSDGEVEFEVTFTAAATGSFRAYVYFATNGSYNEAQAAPVTVGTERIRVDYLSIKRQGADDTILTTTDHPQRAGVNGRKVLYFDGTQRLNSASLASSIHGASDKLLYLIGYPFLVSASYASDQRTFQYSDGNLIVGQDASTTNAKMQNFDGTSDKASGSITSVPTIIRARQTGGNIFLAVDTGAGFVESAGVASGATSAMTGSLIIGTNAATGLGYYGALAGMATANTGAAKPNLENLLREYFFARSQLRWDPYLADLVLKRQ